VFALGHLGVGNRDVTVHEKVYAGLAEFATKKNADLHFSIGEALSCLIGGWRSKALLKFSPPNSGVPMEVEGAGNPTMQLLLPKIIADYANPLRPDYAQASCIWMLSIIKFNGTDPTLLPFLPTLHDKLTLFLSDRDGCFLHSLSLTTIL